MPKRALNAIWPRLSGPEVLQPNIAVGIRDQLKGQPKGPAEVAADSLGGVDVSATTAPSPAGEL